MNRLFANLWTLVQNRLSGEDGQDLVEYALIIALIALACVGGLSSLSGAIAQAFTNISGNL